MAALIREAIAETLERHAPKPRSLGIAASGRHDMARRDTKERPEPRSLR